MSEVQTIVPVTMEQIINRWTNPETRPTFARNYLIKYNGPKVPENACRCAQGDILHLAGYTDEYLDEADGSDPRQRIVDSLVAKMLNISITHSILLRDVNDSGKGNPESVLSNPKKILGARAEKILSFWKKIDELDKKLFFRMEREIIDNIKKEFGALYHINDNIIYDIIWKITASNNVKYDCLKTRVGQIKFLRSVYANYESFVLAVILSAMKEIVTGKKKNLKFLPVLGINSLDDL